MSDLFRLDGKVALVTGASAGIGAAIAEALADAGADVACHGNTRPAEATAAAVKAKNRKGAALSGDLSDRATPARLVSSVLERFGRIDILVNNAGTIRRAPAVEHSDEDWDFVLNVNLTSVFSLCKLTGKHLLEQGSGKIVNITSLLSFQGGVNVPGYSAAKAGLANLTRALANEWAGRGVNVNGIAPGYIETDNTTALRQNPERFRQISERIPAGRWGTPRDLAGAAVFLCSPASDYVHGHVLTVDGGWMGR
ncbi:MAG TPA: 2-dehydro-3-deoxy-D-gluconate 5-dehydrogenase KduD [Polyangiaceae bacterium]|nr:2-dehydro-3-deoxy-D-gluconate 5-dehydrogenase KduD [Polyangiaceae bacterium]